VIKHQYRNILYYVRNSGHELLFPQFCGWNPVMLIAEDICERWLALEAYAARYAEYRQ